MEKIWFLSSFPQGNEEGEGTFAYIKAETLGGAVAKAAELEIFGTDEKFNASLEEGIEDLTPYFEVETDEKGAVTARTPKEVEVWITTLSDNNNKLFGVKDVADIKAECGNKDLISISKFADKAYLI